MTIITSPGRAATLAASDLSNNPFVTGAPLSGSYSTDGATETEAAANAATGTTFDPWVATLTGTSAAWEVDLGSALSPSFVGIAAHNIGALGGSVRVRHSDDGTTWTVADADAATPTDNQAIGWRLQEGAHRYWQVQAYDMTIADVLSIGVIWLGSEIIIPMRIYQGFASPLTPNQVDLNTNVSQGAHLLGSAYTERGSTFSASFSNIEPDFIRGDDWPAFQRRWNRGEGSFWAWRPAKYGDLFWAWGAGNTIAPSNTGPADLMGFGLSGRVYHE